MQKSLPPLEPDFIDPGLLFNRQTSFSKALEISMCAGVPGAEEVPWYVPAHVSLAPGSQIFGFGADKRYSRSMDNNYNTSSLASQKGCSDSVILAEIMAATTSDVVARIEKIAEETAAEAAADARVASAADAAVALAKVAAEVEKAAAAAVADAVTLSQARHRVSTYGSEAMEKRQARNEKHATTRREVRQCVDASTGVRTHSDRVVTVSGSGIRKLGFGAPGLLEKHFSSYGRVMAVLVPSSRLRSQSNLVGHSKPSSRAAAESLAWVVMQKPEEARAILKDYKSGMRPQVQGVTILVAALGTKASQTALTSSSIASWTSTEAAPQYALPAERDVRRASGCSADWTCLVADAVQTRIAQKIFEVELTARLKRAEKDDMTAPMKLAGG